MLFSKKWLRNHQKILLHFLIHIDVFMLCRKFELILTSIFRVIAIFKNRPIFEKSLYYSPCFFPKNGFKITKNFLLHFLIHIMSLCYVESLSSFRLQFFELRPFLKIDQFLKNTLYYSPCFFPKKMAQKSQKIFITFSDAY